MEEIEAKDEQVKDKGIKVKYTEASEAIKNSNQYKNRKLKIENL